VVSGRKLERSRRWSLSWIPSFSKFDIRHDTLVAFLEYPSDPGSRSAAPTIIYDKMVESLLSGLYLTLPVTHINF
jgi:hypothetical protein